MSVKSYYSFATIFSYNATIMGICGGRGLGKTFGAKEKSIKDSLKTIKVKETFIAAKGRRKSEVRFDPETPTNQFVLLRRFKEELAKAKETFFADIEHKFPEWNFRVKGWEAQASHIKYAAEKNRPWSTIGYFVALSVAQNFKGSQFPNVKVIIFDEFILEKGSQYLPNEVEKFQNFYSTVDRYKDKTRVLMLANAVTISNPYFIHYKVDPNNADDGGFIRMSGNYMIWHFPESEAFEAEVANTKFGQFIFSTDPSYANYAVKNKFKDNTNKLIERKPSHARYFLTLETSAGIYSLWYDAKNNKYYVQEKRPSGNETIFTVVPELMSEGKVLATFNDRTMSALRTAFRHDRMRFDRASTTNAVMEIFKR